MSVTKKCYFSTVCNLLHNLPQTSTKFYCSTIINKRETTRAKQNGSRLDQRLLSSQTPQNLRILKFAIARQCSPRSSNRPLSVLITTLSITHRSPVNGH